MAAPAEVVTNEIFFAKGYQAFTELPDYQGRGINGPDNFMPLFASEQSGYMGEVSIHYDVATGEGHVRSLSNRERFPQAPGFDLKFTVDTETNTISLHNDEFLVWTRIDDNSYEMRYEIDSKHPSMATLAEIRVCRGKDNGRTIHKPYIALDLVEELSMRVQIEDNGFPLQINWVETIKQFFQDPVKKFKEHPEQPFAI